MEKRYKPLSPKKRKTKKTGISNTCHGSEYPQETVDFMMAMEKYERENDRPFPTWPEVLAVAVSLGYRKITLPDSIKEKKDP